MCLWRGPRKKRFCCRRNSSSAAHAIVAYVEQNFCTHFFSVCSMGELSLDTCVVSKINCNSGSSSTRSIGAVCATFYMKKKTRTFNFAIEKLRHTINSTSLLINRKLRNLQRTLKKISGMEEETIKSSLWEEGERKIVGWTFIIKSSPVIIENFVDNLTHSRPARTDARVCVNSPSSSLRMEKRRKKTERSQVSDPWKCINLVLCVLHVEAFFLGRARESALLLAPSARNGCCANLNPRKTLRVECLACLSQVEI